MVKEFHLSPVLHGSVCHNFAASAFRIPVRPMVRISAWSQNSWEEESYGNMTAVFFPEIGAIEESFLRAADWQRYLLKDPRPGKIELPLIGVVNPKCWSRRLGYDVRMNAIDKDVQLDSIPKNEHASRRGRPLGPIFCYPKPRSEP